MQALSSSVFVYLMEDNTLSRMAHISSLTIPPIISIVSVDFAFDYKVWT